MKSSIKILLFLTLAFGANAQECNSSRQVTQIAAKLWKFTFEDLRKLNHISKDTTYDVTYFSKNSLDSIRNRNLKTSEILFKYYLEDGVDIPRIAITNYGDSVYLINENGKERLINESELTTKFNNWKSFVSDTLKPFIEVTSYRYCWTRIEEIVQQDSELLAIVNVARTVSPFNKVYETRSDQVEGFVAFDMLFTDPGDFLVISSKNSDINFHSYNNFGMSRYYDNACPCPPNCRSSPCPFCIMCD